jgi:hypothetical protein
LKSTVCVTGGRVLTAATDQIMVSFWFMCRVLWRNIPTLHGAENKKKGPLFGMYYDLLIKFISSKYIVLSVFITPLHLFIFVW